jgi:mRNA-degrading endonuclease toxin of MazEF toxin-antitoxin module
MPSVRGFLARVARALTPRRTAPAGAPVRTAPAGAPVATAPSHSGTETIEVDPLRVGALTLRYAPRRDDRADAGEVVWTWVPFAERDGRGKDRPVLVVARKSADRVYAVKLTSRSHDGDREYVPIGAGDWDSQGRPSWVEVDQLYSVHQNGLRRQGSALDATRFDTVAEALGRRYRWRRA